MNNFHYVAVLLDMMYGLELEDEQLEELGLIAWNLIGNKNVRFYHFSATLDSDNSLTLPCNVDSIEAVTSSCEDWNRVTNYSENGDIRSAYIEQYIESRKAFSSPYYNPGKLLKYIQSGNRLYFKNNYGTVHILYKGIVADNEGLPELTDKEATAIATYLAYITKYKEGLSTGNANTINLAMQLNGQWQKQCDQARVQQLSQNDMNQILDIKDSWNRHSYGFSYKPIH